VPDDVQIRVTDVHATDVLANERTFLAYVRTGLAFVAFGFVVARFSLFAREFSIIEKSPVTQSGVSTALGTAMAILGVAVAIFGGWRYAVTDRALRAGRVVGLSAAAAYAIAMLVAAVGAVVAFALLKFK
jgi:putative membrane protein